MPVMDAHERELYLAEQPVAVLRAHAQEIGISTAGCVEKEDLVQRILHHEVRLFGRSQSGVRDSPSMSASPSVSSPSTSPSASPASSPPRPQSEADLAEDERLARRLQAEEAQQVRALQAQHREREQARRGSPDARGLQQAFEAVMAGGGPGPQLGGPQLTSQQRQLQQHHARRIQQLQEQQQQLQEQQREARQRHQGPRGGGMPFGGEPSPPTVVTGSERGGGDDQNTESVMQLLELLSRGQRGGGGGGGMLGAGAREGRAAPGQPGQRGAGPAGPEALQAVLGQLLASNGGPGGANMLAEVLASLAPQQGIDQAAVDRRTGEMVYREPEGGTAGSAEGGVSAPGSEERTCMVCLEGFTAGEELRILPCLHRYHKSCVDTWLARNRHCPVCKHDVTQ